MAVKDHLVMALVHLGNAYAELAAAADEAHVASTIEWLADRVGKDVAWVAEEIERLRNDS